MSEAPVPEGAARRSPDPWALLFALGSTWGIFFNQLGFFGGLVTAAVRAVRRWWREGAWPKGSSGRTPLWEAPMALLVVATLVSWAAGVDRVNAAGGVQKTLGWMLVYPWAAGSIGSGALIPFFGCLAAAGASQAAFGVWQWWRDHGSDPMFRVYGTLSHAIFFAEIMAMVGLVVLAGWRERSARHLRWSVAGVALMIAAAILSQSRGALVGWAAALLMYAVVASRRWWWAVGGLAAVAVSLAAWSPESWAGHRLRETLTLKDPSVQSRLLQWRTAWRISKAYPLGVGVHNMDKVYDRFAQGTVLEHRSGVHSNIFQILVERGWLGLIALLWLWGAALVELLRSWRSARDPAARGILLGVAGAVLAFFVSGLTEYNIGTAVVVTLFWFLLGMARTAMPSLLPRRTR